MALNFRALETSLQALGTYRGADMSPTIEFCLEQVAHFGKLAEEAQLPRQRETYLRAQARWQELANHAIQDEERRARRGAEKKLSSDPTTKLRK